MKKIMFSVVSVVAALLVSVVMISCGGGGGGGGGSGVISGEQGEPSGNSTYGSSQAFPNGFFKTASGGSYFTGAIWVNEYNSSNALYFIDATHAATITRAGNSDIYWQHTPSDESFEIEITSGANGYIRFSSNGAYPARYAYNITDDVLVISNTRHGTRRYYRCPYNASTPWQIN